MALVGCASVPSPTTVEPSATQLVTWEPSTTYQLPAISDETAESERRRYLDSFAELMDTVPTRLPKVERWVMPDELGQAMANCLAGEGWVVAVTPGGNGYESDVPDSQRGAFALAEYECAAKYPIDARVTWATSHRDPGLLARDWDYLNEYLIPCLREAGYPATEPLPSKESYVANPVWDGYPLAGAVPPGADGVAQRCPRQMPGRYLG